MFACSQWYMFEGPKSCKMFVSHLRYIYIYIYEGSNQTWATSVPNFRQITHRGSLRGRKGTRRGYNKAFTMPIEV